mmetsp:Transcript_28981/g.43731  ORF Transcript_28981/g.43731 Transcript_28981/m.43731 type:complete len:504 (+) Transcript_28981:616-2127(+)
MNFSTLVLESLKVSSPPLVVALSSSIGSFGGLFSLLSTYDIVYSINILSVGSIPLASLLFGCSQLISRNNSSEAGSHIVLNLPIHIGATLFMSITALVLFLLYVQNRSHKHGNLTIDSKKKGANVASFFAIVASTYMASQSTSTYVAMIPVLIGSLIAILLGAFFASVADVWYAVGTGQFQMISLDTSVILSYFVAPLFVLYFRFLLKYGDFCEARIVAIVSFASSIGIIPTDVSYDIENTTMVSLLLSMGVFVAIGVPLINSLCPLGGYMYGRLYTHGQPNTKHIALCVKFADLFNDAASMDEREDLWKFLNSRENDEKNASLNVFVTIEDMKQNASLMKELIAAGHFVGITTSKEYSSFDVFQWHNIEGLVKKSCEEYLDITGDKPSWFHVGNTNTVGVHPSSLRTSYELGMRSAMWSVHINVTQSTGLSDKDLTNIVDGVKQYRGGNFIYITASKRSKGDGSVAVALQQVVSEIRVLEEKGYVFAHMSSVAKENPGMHLS